MIDAFVEGLESLRLPCSAVIVIPSIAAAIFGRRRPTLVVLTFVSVAAFIAWLRFAGWWFETPQTIVRVVVGIVVIAAAVTAWKLDHWSLDVVAVAMAAIVAAWSWIPCVGPQLGDLINGTYDDPLNHLPGILAFFVGLLSPVIFLAAAGVAFPSLRDRLDHPVVVATGAVGLGLVGLLYATSWYAQLSSALVSISTF